MTENRSQSDSIRDRILKRYSPRATWNKMLLIMAAAAALALVFIFLFYHNSTRNLQENVRSSLRQSVEQRKLNIDFRLKSLQQVDSSLMNIIYPIACSDAGRAEQYEEYNELKSVLSMYEGSQYVSNIRLFVPDSKYYSTQGGTIYGLSVLINDTQEDMNQTSGFLTMPQVVGITDKSGFSGQRVPRNVLTFAHYMRHRNDYSTLACVLMLDIEISTFRELLGSEAASDNFGYIVDADGFCMAAAEETRLSQQVIDKDVMAKIRETESGCLESGGQLYVYDKLEECNWYIVMNHPRGILSAVNSSQAKLLRSMTVIVLLVTLSVVFLLAYYYTMNITLTRINTSLDAVNTGKENELEQGTNNLNPLYALERNADQMVLTVKQLMENRYRDQLELVDSQMKSLQAQIKPHFLYNTLDVVKWMILDKRSEDAVWMVNSLSKYLRQSINKGPSVIPLQQELELSSTYLVIMQKRFDNRFSVQYEVEEEANSCMIPKLSLQPLLENALLHGILYSPKPEKQLTIRAWVADGNLYAEVEDNGNGMTEEQRKALEEGQGGYGFANVRKRLNLFSGSQAEVNIFSQEGIGTCIAIQIPVVEKAPDPITI